ncbi:MAG: glycosyltransferase family 4 protein [Fibrella sp.]|nr:glycosyltransferase family 4 protein [Armatimonadota bacterium]
MKILLVFHGGNPLPPEPWDSVGNIIWRQKAFLTERGHSVTIHNQKGRIWNVLLARPWDYDIVHIHDDGRCKLWAPIQQVFKFRLALTSHFAYTIFRNLWHKKYPATYFSTLKVPYHIALSAEMRQFAYDNGYKGKAWVLPNAIHTEEVAFNPAPAPKQAIVLGRVYPRKKQRFLSDLLLSEESLQLDLYGPTNEPDFLGNGKNVVYRGLWDREQVRNNLTDYAVMILISDGEAHAVVIIEALAAGLSLVVSAEAAHNLDTSLPWIHVVDRDNPEEIIAALKRAIAENAQYRAAIRAYCERAFDWRVIGPRYLRIVEAIVQGDGSEDGGEPFLYVPQAAEDAAGRSSVRGSTA